MAQVNLSETVKEEIEQIKEDQGHKSLDSVVRVLLERSRVVSEHRMVLREVLGDGQMPQSVTYVSEPISVELGKQITDEYEHIDAETAHGIFSRCLDGGRTTEKQLLERTHGFIEGCQLISSCLVDQKLDLENEERPENPDEMIAILGDVYGKISTENKEKVRTLVEEYNVPIEEAGKTVAMSIEQESGEWADYVRSVVNS